MKEITLSVVSSDLSLRLLAESKISVGETSAPKLLPTPDENERLIKRRLLTSDRIGELAKKYIKIVGEDCVYGILKKLRSSLLYESQLYQVDKLMASLCTQKGKFKEAQERIERASKNLSTIAKSQKPTFRIIEEAELSLIRQTASSKDKDRGEASVDLAKQIKIESAKQHKQNQKIHGRSSRNSARNQLTDSPGQKEICPANLIKLERIRKNPCEVAYRVYDEGTKCYYECSEYLIPSRRSEELDLLQNPLVKYRLKEIDSESLPKTIRTDLILNQRSPFKFRKFRIFKEFGVCSLEELINIRKHSNIQWRTEELTQILYDCANCVEVLHDAGIFHRNIQPASLVLKRENWMITDFENAETYELGTDGKSFTDARVGSHYCCAPELKGEMREVRVSPLACDLYAMGKLLDGLLDLGCFERHML